MSATEGTGDAGRLGDDHQADHPSQAEHPRSRCQLRPTRIGGTPARTDVVLHVIYLIFTEGHTATAGENLVRADLCAEAIRLGRLVHRLLPDEPEVGGLLAQMLLTDARRDARTGSYRWLSKIVHAGTVRRSLKGSS